MESSVLTELKSVDQEILMQKKLCSKVKVHIQNLIPPTGNRKIRELDQIHVDTLKSEFADRYYEDFVSLIGVVEDGSSEDLEDFKIPGRVIVEVIGGNHTRAALTESAITEYLMVDIYKDLTDEQAIFLAMEHNRVHEHAKKMTFSELVKFFRKIWHRTEKSNPDACEIQMAKVWRSDLSVYMRKSKNDLKDQFKTHLHLARLNNDVWECLLRVFARYEKDPVKGQNGELTQYPFVPLSHVKEDTEKAQLLKSLETGELTASQFRKKCLCYKSKHGNGEKSQIDPVDENIQESRQKGVKNAARQSNENHSNAQEVQHLRECLRKEREHLKEKELIHAKQEKIMREKDDLLKEKDETIKRLRQKHEEILKKHDQDLTVASQVNDKIKREKDEIMVQMCELRKQLFAERLKCRAAEDTAARARAKTLTSASSEKCEKSEDANQIGLQTKKRKADFIEHLKLQPTKQQKELQSDQNHQNVLDENNKHKNEMTVTLALVEYTRGKVYYVVLEDGTLDGTYFKAPLGTILKNKFCFKPSKKSFTINKKDKQSVNEEFLICRLDGKLEGDKVKLDKMSIEAQDQIKLIEDYAKKYDS